MGIMPSDIFQKTQSLLQAPFYSPQGVQITPLLQSEYLSHQIGGQVLLKCENLQTTGSFKIRGATSAMINLSQIDKSKGVVTASSGNHGAATAAAAKALGIPVKIFVPESISSTKEQKILSAGATLVKVPGSADYAETVACDTAKEEGLTYISPYNHIDVMAGQGTIAHEILAQQNNIDAVFMSVGGGGLISGVGSYLTETSPEINTIGCWPENAPAMHECMKAGKIISVTEQSTLSDGTAGGIEEGALTLPICQKVISDTVLVSEKEIISAMSSIYHEHGFIIEGAAGVAVAGLIKNKDAYQGKKVVIILCGKNIEQGVFNSALGLA